MSKKIITLFTAIKVGLVIKFMPELSIRDLAEKA